VVVFPLAMGLAIEATSWITDIGIGISIGVSVLGGARDGCSAHSRTHTLTQHTFLACACARGARAHTHSTHILPCFSCILG
jgi:hypothetical protein